MQRQDVQKLEETQDDDYSFQCFLKNHTSQQLLRFFMHDSQAGNIKQKVSSDYQLLGTVASNLDLLDRNPANTMAMHDQSLAHDV